MMKFLTISYSEKETQISGNMTTVKVIKHAKLTLFGIEKRC